MDKRSLRAALAATAALVAGVLTLATGGQSAGAATVSQSLNCGSLGGTQTMKVDGTAPATVAAGGTFQVDLAIQPAKADGAAIKNLEWAFQAPTGSTLVAGSAQTVGTGTTSGGTLGSVTTATTGSVVFLRVPGEIASGATFRPPTLRFQLKATGAAGTQLPVKVRTSGSAYKLTAAGSINVTCNAQSTIASFAQTTVAAPATTTTTGPTSTTAAPTTTTTTAPAPITTLESWTPGGACGTVQSKPVPAGTTSIQIVATGAAGAKGLGVAGATGGNGAGASTATTTIAGNPGSVLTATLGCAGTNGTSSSGPGGAGWSNGGNGGKGQGTFTSNHYGGGGGGSTAVCVGPNCTAASSTPLVVAAGGGAGGSLNCAGTGVGTGGRGGAAATTAAGSGSGPSGENGTNGGNSVGGAGGANSGGGQAAGGNGGNGSNTVGGTNSGGGGGGGGYVGGNGGGGTTGGLALCVGGGGGGGGASYAVSTGTGTSFVPATGASSVTVTFTITTTPPEPTFLPGSVYVPIVPCRILDTRTDGGALASQAERVLQVTGRPTCVVPPSATAVEASVSAVTPTGTGFARLWPTGATPPNATFVNYVKGQGTTNTGAISINDSGSMTLRNFSGPSQFVIDLQGYYIAQEDLPAATVGSVYVPMVPCRILDTRTGGGALASQASLPVQVTGLSGCAIPPGATATEASVSAVAPTGTGFARLWPTGAPAPTATFVNYVKGQGTTNTGAIPVNADGSMTLKNFSGPSQFVIDVQGYYLDPEDLAAGVVGSTYEALVPCRVYDSRSGDGRFTANRTLGLVVTAPTGSCPIATGATAFEASVSAVAPTATGFTRLWPTGAAAPNATFVNYVKAVGTTNTGSIALSAAGGVTLKNFSGNADYVIDVQGYWRSAITGPIDV